MENASEMFWKNVKSLLKVAAPWPLICYFGLIAGFFLKGFNIVSGFGDSLETGRLTQVFFFDVK